MNSPVGKDNPHTLCGPHFFPSLPTVRLEIVHGKARNRVRPVDVPVFLIGSANDCDLVLGDSRFPDVHTYLFVTPKSVTARCVAPDPELTVNGLPVTTTTLVDHDRIRTGSYEFCIRINKNARLQLNRPQTQHSVATSVRSETSLAIELSRELVRDIRREVVPNAPGDVDVNH